MHVDGCLYNPNTKAFVSYNQKQIHVWNELTGMRIFKIDLYQETKSHNISAFCYSRQKMLYFVISTDNRLHTFNENMICVD